MAYKLVIFDFDGTLADTADWTIGIFNDMAKKHRFKTVSADEIEMLRGKDNREIIAYLGVQKWRLPFMASDMRRRVAAAADHIRLFDGVPELLRTLDGAGIAMGMVSSNSEANIRRALGPDAGRITHYGSGVSLFGKAGRLRKLVQQAGVAPAEVLCVGDETRDIEAARTAGLHSAAVTWGYMKEEVLRKWEPTVLVTSIPELMGVLGVAQRTPENQNTR
jgi:phosphoglycolate phosphatase